MAQLRAEVGSLAKAIEGRIHRFEAEGDAGARAQLGGLAQTVGDLQTSSHENSSRLEALQRELEEVATKLAWQRSAERTFVPATNHEAGMVSEPAAAAGCSMHSNGSCRMQRAGSPDCPAPPTTRADRAPASYFQTRT